MNSSLNHVYRIVWNATLGLWQVASEATRGRGKTGSSQQARKARRALVAASALALVSPAAWAVLPTGGVVVAGEASIQQAGNALNIVQGTDKAAIDWQSFSIGQGNTVNFQQLSSSSVALNRVLGNDVSVIQGAINANGQVFLVNQNGVLFTPTAQVNVGGIVASTQNISTDDFMAGRYKFSGNSAATVENQGSIKAADGGVVALIAAKVINTGSIEALKGTVGLAAGNTVLLDLGGPVKIQVTEGALNAAIEQSGGIRADGGTVYLTAKAAGNLAASVINHTGVTKAMSMAALTGEAGEVAQATGSIALSADLVKQAGMLDVSSLRGGQIDVLAGQYTDSGTTLADGSQQGGSINVRAKNITQTSSAVVSASSSEGEGGRVELIGDLGHGIGEFGGKIYATGRRRGGFVDTSGAKLILNDSLRVDTSSSEGETGTWLLDPIDFTIAATGGDITGAALSTALQSSHVTIQTLASSVTCTGGSITCGMGNTSGNGDIFVNDSINAAGSTKTLTLQASRDINVNKTVKVDGLNLTAVRNVNVNDVVDVSNSLAVNYGTDASFNPSASAKPTDTAALNIGMNQSGFTGKINIGSGGTVSINGNSYTVVRDAAGLASVANNLTGFYVLASDINLASAAWAPIGDVLNVTIGGYFAGKVEGLGHKVSNLSITSAPTNGNAGLFGMVADGVVTNLGVDGAINYSNTATKNQYAGGLAGQVTGSLTTTGSVLRNVFSNVSVNVTNTSNGAGGKDATAGGLIGSIVRVSTLTNAAATGSVSATSTFNNARAGGLIGQLPSGNAKISTVYATGSVTATAAGASIVPAGGLIGDVATNLDLSNAYATGSVTVTAGISRYVGGLIGQVSGGLAVVTIKNVFATGAVTGGSSMGGLVGFINNGSGIVKSISNAYWDGTKTGQVSAVGHVLGFGAGSVTVSASNVAIPTAGATLATTFPNLDANVWAINNGTPYLKAIAPAVTSTPVFLRLNCGSNCFNTYGDTPLVTLFNFGAYSAASNGTLLTDAALTGTATYSVLKDGAAFGNTLNSLTDAGTYTITYTGGLTSGNANYIISAMASPVTWTVNKRTLTVELTGTVNPLTKVYDGTRDLALNTQNFLLGNFVGTQGNGATITQTNGVFNSKDVVTANNLVTASLTAANLSVTGDTKASNYALPTSVSKVGTITAKALTITDSTVTNKTYNGARDATVTLGTLSGLVAVNGVTEKLGATTASGTFASKDVARDANSNVIAQDVTVAYTLANGAATPNGQQAPTPGALASNYSLADQTLQGTITPKALAVTGLTAQSKPYDRLLTATVTGKAMVDTTGVIGQDIVSVEGDVTGGLFATKDVGTQKAVAISGLMLTGAQAGNYMLSAAALTANITAKALTVGGLTAVSKTYDGTRTATVSSTNAVFDGIINGDMLGVTATGLFDTQDAGTNKTVEFSALALSGKDANNYALNTSSASAKADITPKVLTVTGTTVADKIYNGNLGATVKVGELSGFVGSERLGATTATGTFADKDVARDANGEVIAKNVTVAYTLADGATTTSGGFIGAPTGVCIPPNTACAPTMIITNPIIITPGAKASNYTLANETKTAKITPKALTISGSKVTDKQYDGTLTATVTAGKLDGLLDGETLGTTTAVGTFADKNASAEAQNVTTVYTLANGSNAAHKAGNYSLANEVLTGKINQRVLSITGSTVAPKTYDGKKSATVTVGKLGNLVGNETLGTTTAIGEFADPNAGSNKDVAVTYTLANGAIAKASNYTLAGEKLKGTINQKAVTVAGIAANGKTYDGNTSATLRNQGSVATGITGETLSVATTGSFDKKDAGARKINTTTTIANGENGLASNYTLSNATNEVSATIEQKSLTIAVKATDKVYDGKSTATATLSTTDVVGKDVVTLNQTAANFINANQENDKNVGQNKTVRVTGLSLTGDDAANYLLINGEESADTTANLTAKSLTIAATASNKVYNANTLADVTLSTNDMVTGDTLTLNKTAANFDTKNVGMGKTVTVEGLSLGGVDAGNYAISNTNTKATTTANITQAALSVSGITAANKTYDASTNAMVSTANAKLNGLFEGDKLVVSATGSFADKNAGTKKTVNLTSTYAGADVGNYEITDQANTAADIAKRSGVVVTADKQSKTVGSADPKLTFSVTGLLAEDALTGNLTREIGEAAGLYDITQGTLGNNNYVISEFNPAQLTISQPIADVAIANAQTLEPKLDLPSEREAMEERSGDVAPFFIAANQSRANGPAQLVVVNGGIKLPAGQEEQQ